MSIERLRFTEFNESYEKFVPLSNFIEHISDRNKNNKVNNVLSVSNKLGFINQSQQFEDRIVASKNLSNYKIVHKYDFAFNPARINVGSIARLERFDSGIVSPMYIVFRTNDKLNSEFLKQFLDTKIFNDQLTKFLVGSVRQTLDLKSLMKIKIRNKGLEEQEKIGIFLSLFDCLIEKIETKIGLLKELKKGYLQQMFPAKGETVPKIRFSGFDGDWEYYKLSDYGEGYTGISGLNNNYFNTDKDNAIYITYMDVFSKNVITNPSGTFLKENENQNIVKYGDILFTTSSETRKEVGIASLYLGEKPTYLNSFCFGWHSNWDRNHYFISYLFNSNPIRRKIIKLGQGSTRFNISKNKLLNLPLNFPIIKEQEKIGNFLKSLDAMIEKQEKELDAIEQLKNGYMQRLFA